MREIILAGSAAATGLAKLSTEAMGGATGDAGRDDSRRRRRLLDDFFSLSFSLAAGLAVAEEAEAVGVDGSEGR